MLLAGDIGGTKTLLALYDPASGSRHTVAEGEFRSADYPTLEAIVQQFLGSDVGAATYGCFDVAGPVIAGKAHLTNLPWDLDEKAMARNLGLRQVTLLNDLKAVAYAVPHLTPDEFHTLNPGIADPHGPIAVVAPGTGLGEAFLIWGGESYIACSSEGGHASFAPTNTRQAALRQHLADRFGPVSWERVLSGPGIANIYDHLCSVGPGRQDAELAGALAQAQDRTPLISEAGLADAEGTTLAGETLAIFADILGDEAANMALKVLATGGVYLAGGIPAHILPKLTDGRFMRAFLNKGRMSDLLRAMPVHVITARAALIGAAQYGLDHRPT